MSDVTVVPEVQSGSKFQDVEYFSFIMNTAPLIIMTLRLMTRIDNGDRVIQIFIGSSNGERFALMGKPLTNMRALMNSAVFVCKDQTLSLNGVTLTANGSSYSLTTMAARIKVELGNHPTYEKYVNKERFLNLFKDLVDSGNRWVDTGDIASTVGKFREMSDESLEEENVTFLPFCRDESKYFDNKMTETYLLVVKETFSSGDVLHKITLRADPIVILVLNIRNYDERLIRLLRRIQEALAGNHDADLELVYPQVDSDAVESVIVIPLGKDSSGNVSMDVSEYVPYVQFTNYTSGLRNVRINVATNTPHNNFGILDRTGYIIDDIADLLNDAIDTYFPGY